ncbi:hypothetical protein LUZ62_030068 [Rhynchospora pubera]|uniref:SWI/SNF-related matrix-associated actin-dependent regulator of chromatin subfamily A member 3-like 2 n=1 Tax=Rhynchospora pubera TaxID=906938 RepID=A0AAV8HRL8_9POAL|nr:hypothetical protein LUZ62_030068 [Rhynchospora pubera]
MAKKAREEQIEVVRSVVGPDVREMDIIRALHLANDDPTAAINIIFDSPHSQTLPPPPPPISSSPPPPPPSSSSTPPPLPSSSSTPPPPSPLPKDNHTSKKEARKDKDDWWLIGRADVSGLSTCKGRRIQPGETVAFSFPPAPPAAASLKSPLARGRGGFGSEIVRFSTSQHGEIGRIPNEWARCLLPLVRDDKVMLQGFCKSAPKVLSIMDSITLTISVYINIKILQSTHQSQYKAAKAASEESTLHPFPALFRLLSLVPFKKAQFTPDDLYSRKRPADALGSSGDPVTGLGHLEKCRKTTLGRSKDEAGEEEADEESISDSDVDKIIGTSENSELQERGEPETLLCELRPYQKQALHWMLQLENDKGESPSSSEDAATTLHPYWDAYRLADERGLVVYLNSFSGDATIEFPSTLQIARGGILADAMGLGKTIMTISLMLSESGKGCCLSTSPSSSQAFEESLSLSSSSKKPASPSIFTKLLRKPKAAAYVGGGNLIVCPMTLLGQWKAEIETHVKPGAVTLYTHYGQSRAKDGTFLAQSDIVLTTYGVLASEFSAEDAAENGGLYSVHWFRVVLDEAHVIKSTKSQISLAASALSADRRWCLSGTPIQNKLEDIYSLLRFLRIEPWKNWGLWIKLIQKPYEEGDERGLQLVQSILKPIMLRRTKSSTDKEGRPILDLPPANTEVIYCELSEAEKDFYEALFHRSKVKFDQFVEQGKVLHNYASILELLLRLRQCCDHPFLVLSRGDTQEYSDLNKLTKRLLKGEEGASKAYIKEVVEDLEKGERGECPICLEALEDAVLTPCAHRMCRECLFSSWRTGSSSVSAGLCPICRNTISKQELITAPTSNRFRIDVESNWVESSKVSFLLKELELLRDSKLQSGDNGAKTIVFSQWTAFLDLLEIPLSRRSIAYVRLDGTLNQNQRERVIKEFREDRNILVLLMSLKAGGVGINLTAASNAFLMDPWWNPAVEEQALMRIHRIGQTKSVSIKRFIVKGTVEERMEAIQARKQRMICGALTDQEVRTARIQELKMLFS